MKDYDFWSGENAEPLILLAQIDIGEFGTRVSENGGCSVYGYHSILTALGIVAQ